MLAIESRCRYLVCFFGHGSHWHQSLAHYAPERRRSAVQTSSDNVILLTATGLKAIAAVAPAADAVVLG